MKHIIAIALMGLFLTACPDGAPTTPECSNMQEINPYSGKCEPIRPAPRPIE